MPNTQAPVKPPASRPWQAEPLSDVLLELDSSLEGLSELEAARRLAETGPNELNAKPPRTLAQMAREQLTDPMILILLVAAVLSALLQEWAEAGIIFAIVMVNAVIGIVQERKAQSSLEALRSMSAPEARVVRDGVEMVVPARDLVPGDLVQLGDGSMAPADLRLVEAAGLRMQEAALTGESVPVDTTTFDGRVHRKRTKPADRHTDHHALQGGHLYLLWKLHKPEADTFLRLLPS